MRTIRQAGTCGKKRPNCKRAGAIERDDGVGSVVIVVTVIACHTHRRDREEEEAKALLREHCQVLNDSFVFVVDFFMIMVLGFRSCFFAFSIASVPTRLSSPKNLPLSPSPHFPAQGLLPLLPLLSRTRACRPRA